MGLNIASRFTSSSMTWPQQHVSLVHLSPGTGSIERTYSKGMRKNWRLGSASQTKGGVARMFVLCEMNRTSGMIARTWAFLLLPLFLLSIPATNVIAQSDFREYDNALFTIAHPSSWTIDETGVGNPGST
jgi:hypothetical protein